MQILAVLVCLFYKINKILIIKTVEAHTGNKRADWTGFFGRRKMEKAGKFMILER